MSAKNSWSMVTELGNVKCNPPSPVEQRSCTLLSIGLTRYLSFRYAGCNSTNCFRPADMLFLSYVVCRGIKARHKVLTTPPSYLTWLLLEQVLLVFGVSFFVACVAQENV